MKVFRFVITLLVLLLAACGSQAPTEPPTPGPAASEPVEMTATFPASPEAPLDSPLTTPLPSTTSPFSSPLATPAPPGTPPPAAFDGLPLPTERDDRFAASGVCAACHTLMTDEAGKDVSIDKAWRASMMANSARDPYWLASVRAEVQANPGLQATIEDKCVVCHMPMARSSAAATGGEIRLLDGGFADPQHPQHTLAIDGVSCTLCHQIRAEGLGEEGSDSGGYAISQDLPAGQREAFGPYKVGFGVVQIMQSASGFVPIESQHVEAAALCATCHTLYTPYVDAAGQIGGEFPEQTPYEEWLASGYGGSVPCQVCHMPQATGGVRISIVGPPNARSPFYQHLPVGGNTYVLDILRAFPDELAVTASSEHLDAQQAVVRAQLGERTATVGLSQVSIAGSTLTAEVTVSALTGHKFPTSFPSRRAWIHLVVQDGGGQVIFESGSWQPDGSIAGNDNDLDAAAFEPHYKSINSPDQVQIYEAIMGNTDGQVTTTLLRAATYLKDNRLLPAGFDKSTASLHIAVAGRALEDDDFTGGSDRVSYLIDTGDAQGPFTVQAELLYQAIAYRWAQNLKAYTGDEPARFAAYYEAVPNQPGWVAADTVQVGD